MRRLLPLLGLAACAEFPRLDARIPEAERLAPPPALQPLGPLLAAADALPAAPGFVPALRADAAALQARAGALPAGGVADAALAARAADLQARAGAIPAVTTATTAGDAQRLADLQARAGTIPATTTAGDAQRLLDLQARAEALRAQGLTEAERERLLGGAEG